MEPPRIRVGRLAAFVALACMGAALGATSGRAQTDEIQVFTGAIAAPGEVQLTLHNNYTPEGLTTPAYAGAIASQHALNGSPEWSFGTTDWLELGVHFPVYSFTPGGHAYLEGAKLRALVVVPQAEDRRFFYGVNLEFSRNAARWQPTRNAGEIRPIFGVRFGSFDLIANPILDTDFHRLDHLDFAPATRLAWNVSPKWSLSLENYADFGTLNHLEPGYEEHQQLFLVVDYYGTTGVEFGVGHGLNRATDQVVVKLMLTWSVHRPANHPLHRHEAARADRAGESGWSE